MADLVVDAPFATQADSRLYRPSGIWPANLRRFSRRLFIITV